MPSEDPRCEDRGGAASTISRRKAQACSRFGCPSRQSHSDLIASDSFGGVFIGAEELIGRFRHAVAVRMGAWRVRTVVFRSANAPSNPERDILV